MGNYINIPLTERNAKIGLCVRFRGLYNMKPIYKIEGLRVKFTRLGPWYLMSNFTLMERTTISDFYSKQV